MADAIQQSYRAAFLDYIEAEQPTELTPKGKENLSGMVYTTPCEHIIKTPEPQTQEKNERTL